MDWLCVKTFTIHFPISSNNAKHKHNKWFCYMETPSSIGMFACVCMGVWYLISAIVFYH